MSYRITDLEGTTSQFSGINEVWDHAELMCEVFAVDNVIDSCGVFDIDGQDIKFWCNEAECDGHVVGTVTIIDY